jgi:hypothetical protein
MKLMTCCLVAVGIAAVSAPAVAEVDWTAAGKAYNEGKAAGATLETDAAFIECAGYWGSWTDAVHAKQIPAKVLSKLPSDLVPPDSEVAAAAFLLSIDEDDETNAALEAATAKANDSLAAAAGGDTGAAVSLMNTLGGCQL